ncbi:hypothetical protein M2164_005922 [Streptomyces sp. SAI-208]|uniref:hypothetical protein n=1 Tax=Streptomyces sp. SAI-208 TaxID=2940550 RepID=UPI0024743365|nr:hypothetical protein [Streptomyces sp. SAI-208]MDH6610287.1 hypothetical protein [Streptomyces sp. SAI-208]
MTTDWEAQLRRDAKAIEQREQTRREHIAAARLDGHSFRHIGTWASVNHERARQICIDINGDSRTRSERNGGLESSEEKTG